MSLISGYGYGPSFGYYQFLAVFAIILIVAAFVCGIVLRATVFSKKNDGKYHGFGGWLYDLFNFKTLVILPIVKVLYCISACIIAAVSVIIILSGGAGILVGILHFALAEVLCRLLYEGSVLAVLTVTNLQEINKKMGGTTSSSVDITTEADIPNFKAPKETVATPENPVQAPTYTIPTPVDPDEEK